MKATATLLAATTLVGLSGCGEVKTAANNPGYFSFRLEEGTMTGRYNPMGFTAKEVRQLLKAQCTPAVLGSYAKRGPDANGLIGFTATCRKSPRLSRGFFQVEKTSDGKAVVEATGS